MIPADLKQQQSLDSEGVDEPRRFIHPVLRLLASGPILRIICGFYFGEPLHAGGVDLGDPVFKRRPFDLLLNLAIRSRCLVGNDDAASPTALF